MARTPPLTLRRAEPLVSASGELSPAVQSPPDAPYTFLRTLPRRRSLKDKVGSGLRKLVARAKSFTGPAALERPVPAKSKSKEYEDVQEPGVKARDFAHHKRAASDSMSSIPRLQADLHDEDISPPKRLPALVLSRSSSTPRVEEEDEEEEEEVVSPGAYIVDPEPTPTSTSLFGLDETGSSSCDSDPIGDRSEDSPTYVDPGAQTQPSPVEPIVPSLLVNGTPLLKVTLKKTKQKFFRLDADQGIITWESNKGGIIQIENIKEIRTGEKARYYREHFKIPIEKETRWMTISYTSDNKYKILHTIAFSQDTMRLWATTLDSLRNLRLNIMSGIVSPARIWEKHYWRGSDMSADGKLEIEEIERLCRRLGIGARRHAIVERFKSSDKGGKGYLDFTDFQTFVKKLHARPDIMRLWNRMRGEGLFDMAVFSKFMREEQMMTEMTDLELARIFKKYATGGNELPTPPPEPYTSESSTVASSYKPKVRNRSRSRSRSGSFSFTSTPRFKNAQPASPTVCSYPDKEPSNHSPRSLSTPHFTLDDFSRFLLSADNSAFEDREHDMSRPLSEYYISSSHNTYLVGHQLVGESTIEGYIRSLSSGCRSVEVDIWDGDHEPVITHGRTLTGSVSLRHVAQAIAKYAFVTSPYPIVISAEMHAGIEQQSMVSQIFREEFGNALVTCRLDGTTDLEELERLPSPEALKGRVLIKSKNALLSEVEVEVEGEIEETDDGTTDTESLSKDLSRARTIAKRVRSSFRSNRRPDPAEFATYVPPTPTNTLDPMSAIPTSPPRKKQRAYSNRSELERPKLKMSRSLADLLVYTVGVKFRGLNKKEHYTVDQMFSLSEKMANKVLKENWMGLVKHCRTNMVRVYPNGTRVKSTNYEPARYWAAGVQLVAMNWQTIDLGNMMNQSMFMRNGRAGYLLKPEALRVKDKDLLAKRVDYILEITIISAQQIPRKRDENGREIIKDGLVDPLVEVSLHTPEYPSTGSKTYRTTAIPGNGFNPIWEETVSIPFTCVADMWDLTFLRLAVMDDGDDDEPLAVYCSPLGSLRKGYRHLPLHDLQFSQYLFSTLFVHVSLRAA
ncbi:PLC-like phosphodiesterase [Rhizoctonia solani]|nr:PLC-like phosphodiesterase [Rhizoctonia solani]